MSDPAGLSSIVADLQMAFGGKIQRLYSSRPNEVYLETGRDSIAAIAAYLYNLRKIRLAMVFGIDQRKEKESSISSTRLLATGLAASFSFERRFPQPILNSRR